MAFEQLKLSLDKPKATRGPNFTKEETSLIRAAARWCGTTGCSYTDAAEVLAQIMPRSTHSIRMKMSEVLPRRRRRSR